MSVPRQATTLAEVLVSIMILSIGIISLSTLFPISILRSLQATQLTNATILSMNAESLIDIQPDLLFDPNQDGNRAEHRGTRYIVDPLGFARASTPGNLGGVVTRFAGRNAFDPGLPGNNQPTADARAVDAVTLPDSWVFQVASTGALVDASGTASTAQFTFDEVTAAELQSVSTGNEDADQDGSFNVGTEDRNGNGTWDVARSRIVIFNTSGRGSEVRTITGISGQTVSWSAPVNLAAGTSTIARIETQETRYTWLLSVHNNSTSSVDSANVEVVVFFRRPDPPAGETSYDASFTKGGQSATVTFTGEAPALKTGGYVLDATNIRWYRIQKVTIAGTTATLQLDRPAVEAGSKAIVMEGVVEIYPLPPKE